MDDNSRLDTTARLETPTAFGATEAISAIGALASIPDNELLRRLAALLRDSRRTEAVLVAHIGEVDRRGLYARQACSSMFVYCTEVLHLSGHEAFFRITVARAARRHPELLAMLADGRLHLTGIAKLAPHLTAENRSVLLQRAVHESKEQIEELVAELAPRPDAPASIRKLPARKAPEPACARDGTGPGTAEVRAADSSVPARDPLRDQLGPDRVGASPVVPGTPTSGSRDALAGTSPAVSVKTRAPECRIEPIAPARYRVEFTATAEQRDNLERLRDLMRASVPDGDLATVVDAAVAREVRRLESRRFARTAAPRSTPAESATTPSSRYVPAAVRRTVYERDGGRCRYVDDNGRRCSARRRLEYHHRFPYGHGGEHSVENVCLMCHTHNRLAAEADYGRAAAPPAAAPAAGGATDRPPGGATSPGAGSATASATGSAASAPP